MLDNKHVTGRYVGLFLVGCFLFSFPVLTIFNRPSSVFGVPLLFLYLFTAWTGLIFLTMLCTRRHRRRSGRKDDTAGILDG
ncbi:MAG: hypothetical protein HUN04_18800 [Desulfobacter sp.]|nr:MAG: hypothetical protein HUN04_18800 [Desulfobacter sp.]